MTLGYSSNFFSSRRNAPIELIFSSWIPGYLTEMSTEFHDCHSKKSTVLADKYRYFVISRKFHRLFPGEKSEILASVKYKNVEPSSC